MSTLIGLTGKKGAGKSTVASMISNAMPGRVFEYSLAAPIKDFLIDVLDVPRATLYGPSALRETAQRIDWKASRHRLWARGPGYLRSWGFASQAHAEALSEWFEGHAQREIVTARELAQTFGTDFGRKKVHPEIWLIAARDALARQSEPVKIISDCRFDNEARMIADLSGHHGITQAEVWEIVPRYNSSTDGHESERGIAPELINYKIPNFGSLDSLRQTVTERLNTMGLIGD